MFRGFCVTGNFGTVEERRFSAASSRAKSVRALAPQVPKPNAWILRRESLASERLPLPQDDIMQSNLGVAGPCFVAFAKLGTSALWKSGALAPRQSRKISEGFSP